MKPDDRFYEDEVRDGFLVPSAVKQAWGAALIVLDEIDRICTKHNISYFADWGTFLGAVRHGGFIPWDDDFDLCMKRDDYNRFISVAGKELPEGYELINFHTNEDHTGFLTNVCAKSRICFEPEHLAEFHGFPYLTGVDIFILDYVNRDAEEQKKRADAANYIISVADQLFDGRIPNAEKGDFLRSCEMTASSWFTIHIFDTLTGKSLRAQLYSIAEKLFAFVPEKGADMITQMMPFGIEENKAYYRLSKEAYSSSLRIPFENTSIPVPYTYGSIIETHYRDAFRMSKASAGHAYPFFEGQKESLKQVLDFDLPGFYWSETELDRAVPQTEGTYKEVVYEYLNTLLKMTEQLTDGAYKDENVLSQLQQMAVDLGTLMEEIKGEDYDLVHLLEVYCEGLYELSTITDERSAVARSQKLYAVLSDLKSSVDGRREVIFLPRSARLWDAMKGLWQQALADPQTDVYVVPIPYYYKKYDGQLRDRVYVPKDYPAELDCQDYEKFNLMLHHPDEIIICDQYDEYNPITSVNPYFYSSNLQNMTEKLTFVFPYRINDFDRADQCEWANMKYYVRMPGIIRADRVIVPTEAQKDAFIADLCEFAGESTRQVWENKFEVANLWTEEEPDTEPEKYIAYQISFSSLVQYKDEAIAKIDRTLEIFENVLTQSQSAKMLWCGQNTVHEELPKVDADLFAKYMDRVKAFEEKHPGCFTVVGNADISVIVKKCKAFYGDGGVLLHAFNVAGKPVMLQNMKM